MNTRTVLRSSLLLFFIQSCVTTSQKPAVDAKGFETFDEQRPSHEKTGDKFMVVSQGPATTAAGKKMLAMGGNVVDAAVAMSFTISVERPHSTGLGGGGFALVSMNSGKTVDAVDFRERAPRAAHEKMYQDKQGNVVAGLSTEGPLAVGTPGLVAGVLAIHKKYGKLPLTVVMQPAIDLADHGFQVYPELESAMESSIEVLKRFPDSRRIFLKPHDQAYKTGEVLVQKDLAKTLAAIAKGGAKVFYQGKLSRDLTHKSLGLKMTAKDLADYRVAWRKPVVGTYGDYRIFSMPPPSSGGIHVVQILNMIEPLHLKQYGATSPTAIHLTAAAMQRAFADRARFLGDSDFVKVPSRGLLSKSYAKTLMQGVDRQKAEPSSKIQHGDAVRFESDHTTHFTVMDADGNAVSSTQTVNGYFGSGIVAPGTGIVLNNEMDDFSAKPGVPNMFGAIGGAENAVAPLKRPLSSMSPTIVTQDGKTVLALGSPSGTRIISCVLLTALNVMEYEMPVWEAVSSPRYHHQWAPDQLRIDTPHFPEAQISALELMGYKIQKSPLGCRIQAVGLRHGHLTGVSDPRGSGAADGA